MAFTDVTPRIVNWDPDTASEVTLAAACKAGDLLMYEAGWILADIDVATNVQVACKDGAVGDKIPVAPFVLISSFLEATPGGPLCTTAGLGYQQDTGMTVGFFLSATQAYVIPLLVAAAAPV